MPFKSPIEIPITGFCCGAFMLFILEAANLRRESVNGETLPYAVIFNYLCKAPSLVNSEARFVTGLEKIYQELDWLQ